MANEVVIVIDAGLEKTRVAFLEDGDLVGYQVETNNRQNIVGNIYRARVTDVLPGMQAAFLDIGYEKNAFLYVTDAVPQKGGNAENVKDILKPGQEITVQVVKEPIGAKGPKVTTRITLPGRFAVLMPNEDYIGVSKRIRDENERMRLRKLAEKLKPGGMGLILRTASEGADEEDLMRDVHFLCNLWNRIKESEQKGPVPRCLHREEILVYRTVRDHFTPGVRKLVINDREEYYRIVNLVEMISPALKYRVELFAKDYDLFDFYNVEPQVRRALSRKVWLKSGGYLVIDTTEALTVIDVNTGRYIGNRNLEETVLKTNLEAVGEIVKQLRLRDIGGIIIIDFIDMNDQRHRQQVLETLKQEVKKDRTGSVVVGMTGLGLIEMTRKKVRQSLSEILTVECPHCGGSGRIPAAK